MEKPRSYHLEKGRGIQYVDLSCFEKDGEDYLKRCCFLNVGFTYELTAKTAKTMGERLLAVSKWLETEANQ